MIIQSSIEAYQALLADNVIGEIQFNLLKYIRENENVTDMFGGVSRADVELNFNDKDSTYGPRFRELHRLGLIRVAGLKFSPKYNNRRVQYWRTNVKFNTDDFSSNKLSTVAALKQLCQAVRVVCADMPVTSKRREKLLTAVTLAELRQAPHQE